MVTVRQVIEQRKRSKTRAAERHELNRSTCLEKAHTLALAIRITKPEPANWADVGSMAHLDELLTQALGVAMQLCGPEMAGAIREKWGDLDEP
jgi:hypothetical protein